ncbi:DUF221-domain-containing protein [Hymenopellis radicata]|nr:DUF221-domain-containing protein [Hymenopellis radicata]
MSGLDEAGNLINANSRTLAPGAVGSQVVLMSIVSVATILAFNLLRPNNKIIYEPKVKYHVGDKPPPRIGSSLCGWLPPLLYTHEPELLDKIGLDAVTFLRFLRLLRWLFTGITVLTCGILIPINVIYNLRNVDKDNRDILSMLTIRDVSGNWLFAHVAVSYLITFLIIGLVHLHWTKMVQLRHNWFRSPEYLQSFYARTLTVLHVDKRHQSDQGIKEIFDSVHVPYPTTSVHIGRRVGQLPELIEYHNNNVRELETYLVKYLKGGRIGKKRPTFRNGGYCGCGGQKVDAIDFFTNRLKRSEAAIENYRRQIDTRKAENYGFASMAAVPYAHIVAKILAGKHPKRTTILLAPNPKDIIWENMNKADGELARKKAMGFLLLAAVCFFNTVPLFIISILANLSTLTAYIGFLDRWNTSSPKTFALISGILPPAVSSLFGFVLPIIMRWLSQYMGALTHSRLDRAVVARYFAFLIISQLVIFTLIGVIFNSVTEIISSVGKKSFKEIIDNLHTLPDTINRTYINQASYWLTFFPLRGFLAVFDLAQIINLLWLSFKTHVFGRSPRDIREWTQPPEFQYAVYYGNTLLMVAVAMVFAPLAPLVPLAACIVFWMSSFVYKYQLMFVFISKVESGGRLWNVVINRLLFCVVLMQSLLVLTIGLQYGWTTLQWLWTVPPIFIVAGYKFYSVRAFESKFKYYNPTEEELRTAKVHSERADNKGNRLEKRFGHPALNADLFTPMLHANMMPLLSQVYGGTIGKEQTTLDEYGGQKMDAQIVGGGIKIAAINQADLEYDPVMYQRDRGELDWDARSMASTMMDGPSTLQHAPSQFYASSTTLLNGYERERYLASGPGSSAPSENYELTTLDSPRQPLLSPASQAFYQQQGASSSQSFMQTPPVMYNDGGVREAPVHRPSQQSPGPQMHIPPQRQGSYDSRSQSPSPYLERNDPRSQSPYMESPRSQSPFTMERNASSFDPRSASPRPPPSYTQGQYSSHGQHPSQQHSRGGSGNLAGRGAFRS